MSVSGGPLDGIVHWLNQLNPTNKNSQTTQTLLPNPRRHLFVWPSDRRNRAAVDEPRRCRALVQPMAPPEPLRNVQVAPWDRRMALCIPPGNKAMSNRPYDFSERGLAVEPGSLLFNMVKSKNLHDRVHTC
jgi:hypothetical protein